MDDDIEDGDVEDEISEPLDFGCCLPPGECCMPGLHLPSECHTAEMYEMAHGGAHIGAGPRKPTKSEF